MLRMFSLWCSHLPPSRDFFTRVCAFHPYDDDYPAGSGNLAGWTYLHRLHHTWVFNEVPRPSYAIQLSFLIFCPILYLQALQSPVLWKGDRICGNTRVRLDLSISKNFQTADSAWYITKSYGNHPILRRPKLITYTYTQLVVQNGIFLQERSLTFPPV
uniref:Uncharacterized protein n=1 Tax=Myoviridae sp. ctp7F23 TaxID=2825174 RepID=A0A8S5U8N1_9CAUD|nr:MAG TPA: hypothetical protein [Myoviridae sp. ctp7F23]